MQYRSTRGGEPVSHRTGDHERHGARWRAVRADQLPQLRRERLRRGDRLPGGGRSGCSRRSSPVPRWSRISAAICREALDFPVPARQVEPGLSVLELFHGPTAAFKDVGARFLARGDGCDRRDGADARPPVTILVATSGDTGGAVAAAFHRRPGFRVVVLYPRRAGLAAPGAPAHLLGRQRRFAVRCGVSSTTASGW